jgi:glycosyltransferase involved in cell wall biosynthesis
MKRPARVVFMSHTLAVGGAEEMVLNLMRHLPRDRFDPRVCCIGEPGPMGEEIARSGGQVVALDACPGLRHPFDVLRIRRFLRLHQPDIVHTFLLTASVYGRFAALLARVPVIVGTEVNMYSDKRGRHILAERLLAGRTDYIVTSAEAVRRFYIDQLGIAEDRIGVIYNAVDFDMIRSTVSRADMRRELGIDGQTIVAGVIARLHEQKGHDVLLAALASEPALAGVHLLVIGDGALRPTLESLASALGLAERVRFLGARRDLGNLLGAMDVFVLPSRWEGLPLSLVLAMGAGRPVVATSVAGIPEVVTDGVDGLLVPPGDSVALGRALARVVGNRPLSEALGAAGARSVLPRFGVDRYVESVSQLYERLLARRQAA